MKKLIYIAVFAVFMLACNEENYLRLPLNQELVSLKPDYSSSKRFVSNNGDTIVMRQISNDQYFEKNNSAQIGQSGALPEADYVELERQKLVIGSDTPYLRFSFELQALYDESSPRYSIDKYSLQFEDELGAADTELQFEYRDSLICLSQRCATADTLKLLNRTFFDCYFTPRDSVSRNALYLNRNRGLVGFKGLNNQIFELID